MCWSHMSVNKNIFKEITWDNTWYFWISNYDPVIKSYSYFIPPIYCTFHYPGCMLRNKVYFHEFYWLLWQMLNLSCHCTFLSVQYLFPFYILAITDYWFGAHWPHHLWFCLASNITPGDSTEFHLGIPLNKASQW